MEEILIQLKILIQIEIFDRISDMSGGITRQVWKTLLESGEGARHIWCQKPDSPVLTGQRIKKENRENLRS
jgi:hypothetical protein